MEAQNSQYENELKAIRKEIFLTAYSCGTAHLASAFSLVEIMYALYEKKLLKYDASNPDWEDRDRLILSKGHASLSLYVMLQRNGFFSKEVLRSFSKPESILGGEPKLQDIPGAEASTGSLGHGLSLGVGMAMAHQMDGNPSKTYVIVGDGECEEGTIWEAIMSAARYHLDHLTVILDCNGIQKMGPVENTMGIKDWRSRFEAFDWDVQEIQNGHDMEEVMACLQKENTSGKPCVILAHTVKGKGVSIMENNHNWHFKMPNKRELKVFMEELDITQEELDECRRRI